MIIVFHDRVNVTKVFDYEKNKELSINTNSIQAALYQLANENQNQLIVWCNNKLEENLNLLSFKSVFHHNMIMASYTDSKKYTISDSIGYVEDSSFLKVKHDVSYPTWLMSSDVGGIYAQVLVQFKKLSSSNLKFDEFLNHVSKQGIKNGLFCYSDPKLLKDKKNDYVDDPEKTNLFYFIKNQYRLRWMFILLFNYLIYEKRFKFWSFLKAILRPKFSTDIIDFSNIEVLSTHFQNSFDTTYDVLIPTLGRAKVLKDVLVDLCSETILPQKIIIVEQNALPDSKTELDYIYNQEWPFEIDHTFTHQLGACNARNIALKKITSTWVFMADDDIRLDTTLVENTFKFIKQYGTSAITIASVRKGEKTNQLFPIQWKSFASGTSFVKSSEIKDIEFGMEHEFGFGEDSDFGMKIRNKGTDVIFYPHSSILHLKAPIGGFRAKTSLPWDDDNIQPKPSPMVLAHRIKHTTSKQLLGYKTILFFKFFKVQNNKNPFSYIKNMKRHWEQSVFWANKLIKKYSHDAV